MWNWNSKPDNFNKTITDSVQNPPLLYATDNTTTYRSCSECVQNWFAEDEPTLCSQGMSVVGEVANNSILRRHWCGHYQKSSGWVADHVHSSNDCRNFSNLKLIKFYLSPQCSQNIWQALLSSAFIMQLMQIFFNEGIIDDFASETARKVRL